MDRESLPEKLWEWLFTLMPWLCPPALPVCVPPPEVCTLPVERVPLPPVLVTAPVPLREMAWPVMPDTSPPTRGAPVPICSETVRARVVPLQEEAPELVRGGFDSSRDELWFLKCLK